MATNNVTGYIPISAIRPTDPGLAFAIFRNGNVTQLLAGAELKATQGGHQTAFADTGFGGGALAHLPDLPSFLGGDGDDEDDTLPESIRRLRHPPSTTTGGETPTRPPQAPTPGAHHSLGGLTPTKAGPAGSPAGGGRSLDKDMDEEGAAARRATALAEGKARLARQEARRSAPRLSDRRLRHL